MPLVSFRAPASGLWRADVGSLAVGDTAADVRQAIGGETSADAAVTLRRRPPPPAMLVVRAPQTIHSLGTGPVVSGTGAAGGDVLVTANGSEVDAVVVGVDGRWSIDLSVLGGGWWSLVFVQTAGGVIYPAARRTLSVEAYAAETQAVLDRWIALGTPAPKADADWLDGRIKAAKDARQWQKLDGFWRPMHSALAATVNLAAPAGPLLTAIGVPIVTPFGWYAGDGVGTCQDTGINPSLGSTRFKLDSATLFVFSLTNANNGHAEMGTGPLTRLFCRNAGALTSRANGATTGTTTTADSRGLIGWTRNRAGSYDHFKDGAVIGSPAIASSGINNATVKIGAAGTIFSSRLLAFAGMGSGFSPADIAFTNVWGREWLARDGVIAP